MKYPDGNVIQPGDRVSMENGRATGTVEEVLDSPAKRDAFGLDESDGDHVVFSQDGVTGLVLIAAQGIQWDEIKLISRK